MAADNKIFVSIVSHGHDSFIMKNDNLIDISLHPDVVVLIKDNLHSNFLRDFCAEKNIAYLRTDNQLGFGENNNYVYKYCSSIGMRDTDWFLVLNPDVEIQANEFFKIIDFLRNTDSGIFTINLYKDRKFSEYENSVRYFPRFWDVSRMFFGKSITKPYDKDSLSELECVDWSSGAFILFDALLYKKLNGFDQSYFMYYEDVDICYRAFIEYNEKVKYIKSIRAVHSGAYNNRKLFSKHFLWYIKSMFRFLWRTL
ncbi:glycosyltransferase family 2 protein [Vibrio mimicus]|uniref:glycosyltransferase family 2 protein n=1 Tax=Vibrio mimicus TaxID=674 RepID=UPI0011D4CE6D|nr:glycosyltransferase family 2 protein [Vibrio mimicus]TXZ07006.1 glycosyltransferase family 2 protein [Vibrio mimicus]BCN22701.1 rhamnosyltransferase [Vibrio mimicus]